MPYPLLLGCKAPLLCESLVFQLKPSPSQLSAGSPGWEWEVRERSISHSGLGQRKASLSPGTPHCLPPTYPPHPPSGTSGKNPSLCKQGHRKASTLICYQFSFSSSATWLERQPGGGSWPDPSPFLLYLFSLASTTSSPVA